ncbi:MAG: heavy metal translocating P-type ATPase metal-binding domain-containing protein, partial [Longimicrobiales bacterium]
MPSTVLEGDAPAGASGLGASADDAAHRCLHCGIPVERAVQRYCCRGCELAAEIVSDAGLGRYYRDRTEFPPRPGALEGAWDDVPFAEHADGTREIRFAVDGLRCASCVWLSERVLSGTEGVVDAHVSYGTGRASLRWDPARTTLSALVRLLAALGYQPRLLGEEARPDRSLMMRLGVAVFAAMNIMLIHVALYAAWGQAMEPRFQSLFQWTALALATPLAMWCADPFYRGAWRGTRVGQLHMDLPIAIAVLSLYVHGVLETVRAGETYLDSMGMLVALLLAGRVLESNGRRKAAEAAVTLGSSIPARARRWSGRELETVAAEALRPGDRVELAVGEEAAADGVVTRGRGRLDRAIVTGESEPVLVGVGGEVVAGSALVSGSLEVEVTGVG